MNCLLRFYLSPLVNSESLAEMQMSVLCKTNSITVSIDQGILNYIYKENAPSRIANLTLLALILSVGNPGKRL